MFAIVLKENGKVRFVSNNASSLKKVRAMFRMKGIAVRTVEIK